MGLHSTLMHGGEPCIVMFSVLKLPAGGGGREIIIQMLCEVSYFSLSGQYTCVICKCNFQCLCREGGSMLN